MVLFWAQTLVQCTVAGKALSIETICMCWCYPSGRRGSYIMWHRGNLGCSHLEVTTSYTLWAAHMHHQTTMQGSIQIGWQLDKVKVTRDYIIFYYIYFIMLFYYYIILYLTWSGATASAVGGYISYAVAWMKMTTLLQLPNGFAKGLIAKTPCPWHCNRLRKVTLHPTLPFYN